MRINQDVNSRKLFVFEALPQDLERIQELFDSGELSNLLDVDVLDVGIVTETGSLVPIPIVLRLSNWFKANFDTGWQTIDVLFNTRENVEFAIRNIRENDNKHLLEKGVSRGKIYDLGIQIAGNPVALIVTLISQEEADEQIDICLQVYPTNKQIYLPANLQLIVLDGSGTTCLETKSRNADNWIQLEFSGKSGERFSVKLALGDTSITENFVI